MLDEFQTKFQIFKTNYLQYFQLIAAIPQSVLLPVWFVEYNHNIPFSRKN